MERKVIVVQQRLYQTLSFLHGQPSCQL
jgi:hypothetical protein